MNSPLLWYSARAAGIVAWALATASVVWGLALSTRVFGTKPRSAWLLDLHRFLGAAAVIFVGIHVLSVLFDTYTHFGIANVLVPLTGTWHPVAVAWGIVALYVLVAVELTSLARAHLPRRFWRRTHYASFAVFALTTVHALTAGSDARSGPFVIAVIAACALVGGLAALRAVGRAPEPSPSGTAGPSPSAAVPRARIPAGS